MPVTAFEFANKIRAIDFTKEIEIVLSNPNSKAEIVELNQEQLYNSGIRSDGIELTPYVPQTVLKKQAKGQPYDHKTLKDTGIFYDGFYVETQNAKYMVASKDPKSIYLEERNGLKIYGLTDANREIV